MGRRGFSRRQVRRGEGARPRSPSSKQYRQDVNTGLRPRTRPRTQAASVEPRRQHEEFSRPPSAAGFRTPEFKQGIHTCSLAGRRKGHGQGLLRQGFPTRAQSVEPQGSGPCPCPSPPTSMPQGPPEGTSDPGNAREVAVEGQACYSAREGPSGPWGLARSLPWASGTHLLCQREPHLRLKTVSASARWGSIHSLPFLDFFFFFLGPHPRHMEVPRLGAELELHLPAYTTATATRDPSCICNLRCNVRQCWILNPRSEARDRTCILMDTTSGS